MIITLLLITVGFSTIHPPADSISAGKWKFGGYIDTYFGSSLYSASKSSHPFFVSSAQNNQANINLAYAELKFENDWFRMNVAPAMGSYMRANYAAEKENNKYIFEANAGFRFSKKYNVWVDGGILDSPYSSEGPVSRDQLMYSRSFAPEYVPYYLSGIRLTIQPSDRWSFKLMRLNGWQQITDQNFKKSIGTSLTIKTGNHSELTYNTYFGDERSIGNLNFRMRAFHDLYMKISDDKKWDAAFGGYIGVQNLERGDRLPWWQINVMGRKSFSQKISLSGRVEFFNDPNQVMIRVPESEFRAFSTGTCLNLHVGKNTLFRIDGRYFLASEKIYEQRSGKTNRDVVLMASMTSWF